MTLPLPDGHPTGLHDSNGNMIKIGDLIRRPVDINQETHGEWSHYRVIARGIVPVLSYVRSERGEVLPPGLLASPLSELYPTKLLLFAKDLDRVRPEEDLHLVLELSEELTAG